MKKIISLLGAASLIATGGVAVVACQTNDVEKDPFYKLPATRPSTMDEVKEIIAYYWDLQRFYNEEYWLKEYPKIKTFDSENWQKMEISGFVTDAMCGYSFIRLGYDGKIEIEKTPEGNKFSEWSIDKENLQSRYDLSMNPTLGDVTQKTKEWITNWYSWVLVEENN